MIRIELIPTLMMRNKEYRIINSVFI